jgi:hypothetical protein
MTNPFQIPDLNAIAAGIQDAVESVVQPANPAVPAAQPAVEAPAGDTFSVDHTEGDVSGYGGFNVGGGVELSIGIPGGPEFEVDTEGRFGAYGGFDAHGAHEHVDYSGDLG